MFNQAVMTNMCSLLLQVELSFQKESVTHKGILGLMKKNSKLAQIIITKRK